MNDNKVRQRQELFVTQTAPTGIAPTAPFAPMLGTPFTAPLSPFTPGIAAPYVSPLGVGPAAPSIPPGTPVAVAPVRRIVHPTRVIETHTVTRYPIVNVFPTHTRRVHHNVYEYYCEYPCTESNECCDHKVNCC
jgi:hypothetical protein